MSKARTSGKPRGKATKRESQVRIIGGQWRGRKLGFYPRDGLRPTTDRIRETLFNWLTPHIQDACVADLFAGSGALGIEALSRGALHCDFVEPIESTCAQIKSNLEILGAQQLGNCHNLPAEKYLETAVKTLDIVFIDPPFSQPLATPICHSLMDSGLLAKSALVYLESNAAVPCPEVPGEWTLHREKVSGGVAYRLFHVAD